MIPESCSSLDFFFFLSPYFTIIHQSAVYDLHIYHHFFMLLQLALTPAVQPTATWDVMVGNSSSCSVPALSSSSSEQITSGDGLLGWGLVLVHGGKKAAERCLVCSVLHPGALLGFGSRLSACCKLEIVPLPPPSPPLFFFPSLLYSCVLGRICGFVT